MTQPASNGPTDGQPPAQPPTPNASGAQLNAHQSSQGSNAPTKSMSTEKTPSANPLPSPLIDYSTGQPAGVQGDDLVSPEDEMLVAYLDGELNSNDVMALEAQIQREPRLKRRLDELRSAWDLLEELPPARPSPNFAQSTIEMVAMSAAAIEVSPIQRRRNRWWFIATLVIAPIMLIAGYTVTRASQRYTERHTIEQVHLLADWDAFKAVDNFEWLEHLAEVDDITRVAKRSATSGLGIDIVPPTVAERKQWIESLSPIDRDRLSANLEEFKRISPAESQRLLKLADQIYAHKERDHYLQLARSYSIFLTDMSISDRTSFRDQKNDEVRLSELKRRVNLKLVEIYASDLSAEDKGKVAEWIKMLQEEYGDTLGRGGVFTELFRRRGLGDSIISDEDIEHLYTMLSPESQEILGRLQNKEDLHEALIFYFVLRRSQGRTSRAEYIERFQQLPTGVKTGYEFLPPDVVHDRLNNNDPRGGRRPPPSRGGGR